MEDIIEKVLKYSMMIINILSGIANIIRFLRTRYKPKHYKGLRVWGESPLPSLLYLIQAMKTSILSDIGTMALILYIIIDDNDVIAYILFAIMLITNIVKWIVTKDGE